MKQSFAFHKCSHNSKLGRIPATYSPRDTCPPSCGFYKAGCYAEGGHVSMFWKKVNLGEKGMS